MVDVRSVIPIQYMGSKSRIAKYIVPILQKEIDDNNINTYIEAFCGGCNLVDKIECDKRIANDNNPYLIALLDHVARGGGLRDTIPRDYYNQAKVAWKNNDLSEFEKWELGAIGFLASFNGKGFRGGYAKPGYEKTKTGLRYRDYYREAKDNLLKQAPHLYGIEFSCRDYQEIDTTQNALIYCDPPYMNTTGYSTSSCFDYDKFWQTMRDWSQNNIVYISELQAPDDFECVWEQEVSRSIKATDKSRAVEKLFRYKGE